MSAVTRRRVGVGGRGHRVWLAVAAVAIVHLVCYRATAPLRLLSHQRSQLAAPVDSINPFASSSSSPSHHVSFKRSLIPDTPSSSFYIRDGSDPATGRMTPHEDEQSDALIDWTAIYSRGSLNQKPFLFLLMILWLVFLFAFVGITASDFFCPNLSTIASRLGLSESVAGVTFLAFSNGSPDVFSTFAALSHGSGSLAIGELIGAASFIVSVVAGTMCLIKPFRVSKHTFLRDVGFFTIAVTLTLLILWDSHIHLWEAIGMVLLYVIYVAFVAVGSWWMARKERKEALLKAARDEYADEGAAWATGVQDDDLNPRTPPSHRSTASNTPLGTPLPGVPAPQITSPRIGSGSAPHPHQHQILDDDALVAAIERGVPVTLTRQRSGTIASQTPGSIMSPDPGSTATASAQHVQGHSRRPSQARRPKTRSTVRPSLLGAIEFRDVVNSLRADSSARTMAVFGGLHDEQHAHATFVGAEADVPTRPRAASHSGAIRLGDDVPDRQLQARPGLSRDRRTTWTADRIGRSQDSEGPESEGPSAHWSEVDEEEGEDDRERMVDLSEGVENPWQGATSPGLGRRSSSGSMRNGPGGLRIDIPSTAVTSRMRSAPPTLHRSGSDTTLDPNDPDAPTKTVRKVPSILLTSVNGSMSLVQPAAEVKAPRRWLTRVAEKRGVRIARAVCLALFPSLQDFEEKSYVGKATAILCVPAILLLNLTLPVVDSDEDDCRMIEEKEDRLRHHPAHDGDFVSTPVPFEDYDSDAEEIDGENGFDSLESRHAREAVARKLHQRVLARDDDPFSVWNASSAANTPAAIDFSVVDRGLESFSITSNEPTGASSAQQLPPSIDPLSTAPPGNDATTPPSTPMAREPIDGHLLTRWLTAVQCTLGPVFITCALTLDSLKWYYPLIALAVGLLLAVISFTTFTSSSHRGRIVLCFVGFVVAAVWILLIVSEVVGVLQTIGHIFGLSDAILGLTIFAMGNSLGDLVANVTVARMGYPSMAIAACFGGPMLNILLGIGLSGCYMIARHDGQPLNVDMSRTLLVSGGGLWAILFATLILVPMNGFWMDKRLGAGLIAAYSIVLTINVLVEIFAE